jgi:hypothetical protein
VIPGQFFGSLRHYPNVGGDLQMKDEPEESERRRRDMRRIAWILLPITAFFFLLLVIQRFWLGDIGP